MSHPPQDIPENEARALREALDTGAPEPGPAMRAALDQFRARLPRHRTVRRMDRGSFWYWLFAAGRTLRWASLALGLVILCASMTASGRTAMVRFAGITFDTLNGFVKRRVDAGYDTYHQYQDLRAELTSRHGNPLEINQFLGVATDGELVLMVRPEGASFNAVWKLNRDSGKITILTDTPVQFGTHPIIAPGHDGKIQGLVYTTANTGFGMVVRAALTGEYRLQSLWWHDLTPGSRPILIDDGTGFGSIFSSPDRKTICYGKGNPRTGGRAIMIWGREDGGLRQLRDDGVGIPLAFAPRGDSFLIAEQRFIPGGQPEIAGIRQVSLTDDSTVARLDFPPGRSYQGCYRLKDCLLLAHVNLDRVIHNGGSYETCEEQIHRIALEPSLHFIDPPFQVSPKDYFHPQASYYPETSTHIPIMAVDKPPNYVKLYDARTLKLEAELNNPPFESACWSPDASRLACTAAFDNGFAQKILIYEPATGKTTQLPCNGYLLGWINNHRMLFYTGGFGMNTLDLDTREIKEIKAQLPLAIQNGKEAHVL